MAVVVVAAVAKSPTSDILLERRPRSISCDGRYSPAEVDGRSGCDGGGGSGGGFLMGSGDFPVSEAFEGASGAMGDVLRRPKSLGLLSDLADEAGVGLRDGCGPVADDEDDNRGFRSFGLRF